MLSINGSEYIMNWLIPYKQSAANANNNNYAQARSGSFGFAYTDKTGQSRQESSDGNGEVTGQYSYTSPEGKDITVRYKAGRNGFEILNPEEVYPSAK
jgi:hypothetical protein